MTLQVLKGAGAKCGEGAAQKILTQCPAARFCVLPTGEICVYGINEIPHMTQINAREIAAAVVPMIQPESWAGAVILATVFLAGIVLGRFWKNRMEPTRAQSTGHLRRTCRHQRTRGLGVVAPPR